MVQKIRPAVALLALIELGCAQSNQLKQAGEQYFSAASGDRSKPLNARSGSRDRDQSVQLTGYETPNDVDQSPVEMASAIETGAADLSGPQSVDTLIQLALVENRLVRAAWYNVEALKHRIPQVTSLEDPVVSNTIFPIPSVAPQYSLMGYMPYDALVAQQFPWFGTLKLRGQAAEEDVRVAINELAAAQLDTVASVKRAYFDLWFNERTLDLLQQNRTLAEDFLKIAKERYKESTAIQVDVLRAETAVSDIDREIETTRLAISTSRADLAQLLHLNPDTEFMTIPDSAVSSVAEDIDRLYQLAIAVKPELQGRLAAIERDEKAIELAEKRYYPNVSLGVIYQNMQKTNAMTPETAGGMPNIGLFVGFNLPIYRKRIAAGVQEAVARASANAELYEADRDQTLRDVKDLFNQVKVQQNILGLLRRTNLPNSQLVLKNTASDYRAGNVDYLSLISAWRDVLQVELQITQIEAELSKSIASLERAVGIQISESPMDIKAITPEPASVPASPPPVPATVSPFEKAAPTS